VVAFTNENGQIQHSGVERRIAARPGHQSVLCKDPTGLP